MGGQLIERVLLMFPLDGGFEEQLAGWSQQLSKERGWTTHLKNPSRAVKCLRTTW